jgi:hypothetical protein
LAQWTFWSRKEALLNYAHAAGKSIGDLDMQLDFLATEIAGYKAVMEKLKTASSVREASDAVLTGYERPADQSEAAKESAGRFRPEVHDKYAKVFRWMSPHNDEMRASGLGVGSIVEFTPTATTYTPGGKTIPAWVKGYYHRVTKDEYRGKPRVINGATCVCLGEKRAKSVAASQPFEQGINTWVAVSNLRLVAKESDTVDDSEGEGESGADSQNFTIYTVAANDYVLVNRTAFSWFRRPLYGDKGAERSDQQHHLDWHDAKDSERLIHTRLWSTLQPFCITTG